MKKMVSPRLLWLLFVTLLLCQHAYAYEGSEDLSQAMRDVVITTKIKGSYFQDKLLNPFDIGVKTRYGQVTLSGVVDSDMQYEKAVVLARSTSGVISVNVDALKVKKSRALLSDVLITAKIEGLLFRDSIVRADRASFWGIHVETKDSVVYLSGRVDSALMKQHIIAVASSVAGVKKVYNDLQVQAALS